MFGEKRDYIKISKNVTVNIPDSRICKTCDRFDATSITHYEEDTKICEVVCENSAICKHIYNEMRKLLETELDKNSDENIWDTVAKACTLQE